MAEAYLQDLDENCDGRFDPGEEIDEKRVREIVNLACPLPPPPEPPPEIKKIIKIIEELDLDEYIEDTSEKEEQ